MKRLPYYLIILTMALVLVACERPLQEEVPSDGIPPTIAPLDIQNTTSEGENTGAEGGSSFTFEESGEGTVEDGENAGTEGATEGGEGEAITNEGGEGEAITNEGGEGEGTTEEVGAGQGEATTVEQPAVVTNEAGDVIHTVVSGDLMGRLAEQYGVTVQDILVANGLTNPDILSVGDQLIIPTSGTVTAPDGSTTNTGSGVVHYVQPGDTLFRIALTYGTTVEILAAHNGIADVNTLEVGQAISIP